MMKNKQNQEQNEYSKLYLEVVKEIHEFNKKQRKLKSQHKKQLKDLINVNPLYKYLNQDLEFWYPLGIVEIYNVDEKRSGYSNYQHVRIKDDKDNHLYMVQPFIDVIGIDHDCVYQEVGYLGDDYSGYLLYPLTNGKYFKIEYTC